MKDEQRIAKKKEEILELARKMGTEEDAHDYINVYVLRRR